MSAHHDYELADTISAVRRDRERRQERQAQRLRSEFARAGMDDAVFLLPENQQLIRRVGESVDSAFPDRLAHVRAVVLDVIAARSRPRHPVHPNFHSYTTGSAPSALDGSNGADPEGANHA